VRGKEKRRKEKGDEEEGIKKNIYYIAINISS